MSAGDRLAEIRARAEAATPGPWEISRYRRGGGRTYRDEPERVLIADTYTEGDREFLHHAREDIPALLAAVEAVLGKHHPTRTEVITDPECCNEECGHEPGECPEECLDVCSACWDLCEEAYDYFSEVDIPESIKYPCLIVRAITEALA